MRKMFGINKNTSESPLQHMFVCLFLFRNPGGLSNLNSRRTLTLTTQPVWIGQFLIDLRKNYCRLYSYPSHPVTGYLQMLPNNDSMKRTRLGFQEPFLVQMLVVFFRTGVHKHVLGMLKLMFSALYLFLVIYLYFRVLFIVGTESHLKET